MQRKRTRIAPALALGLMLAAPEIGALTTSECRAAWDRSEAAQTGDWSWAGGTRTVERCDNVQVDVVLHQEANGAQEEVCRISARCTNGPDQDPSRETFTGPVSKVECLAHWPIGPWQGLHPDAC